jgi:hypothetical protein
MTDKTINLAIHTLKLAKEKLEIYRDHSNGEYQGGLEHTAMIRTINETLGILKIASSSIEQPPDSDEYKVFTEKCAAVANHEGWQGAYFQEARDIVGMDYEQLPYLHPEKGEPMYRKPVPPFDSAPDDVIEKARQWDELMESVKQFYRDYPGGREEPLSVSPVNDKERQGHFEVIRHLRKENDKFWKLLEERPVLTEIKESIIETSLHVNAFDYRIWDKKVIKAVL